MAKKFNIHDWQDKQRRLNEQEDSETGNTSGETLSPLDKLVDRVLNVTDGRLATWQMHDKITSSHDMMDLYERDKEKLRMLIYNHLRDDIKEHHNDEDFPKQSETVNKILDFLKQNYHIKIYDAVEDYLKSINEMNTTGGGASFNAGAGEGYMTPRAFKKKNKED